MYMDIYFLINVFQFQLSHIYESIPADKLCLSLLRHIISPLSSSRMRALPSPLSADMRAAFIFLQSSGGTGLASLPCRHTACLMNEAATMSQ